MSLSLKYLFLMAIITEVIYKPSRAATGKGSKLYKEYSAPGLSVIAQTFDDILWKWSISKVIVINIIFEMARSSPKRFSCCEVCFLYAHKIYINSPLAPFYGPWQEKTCEGERLDFLLGSNSSRSRSKAKQVQHWDRFQVFPKCS